MKKKQTTPTPIPTPAGDESGNTIAALRQQITTLETNWKRALADYQNLLKRIEADKKDFIRFATSGIMAKIIPSLDILELAAKHSQDPGVKLAVKQLADALSAEGLEEINPQPGQPFDHDFHECIETLPGQVDSQIAETVSKGYKIEAFVIRPAKVKVFKLALDK